MKRILTTLFLSTLLVVPVLSQSPIDALFPVKPKDYVTDQANILSNGQFAEIHLLAKRLRETTTVELAVVTLPSLNDRAPVEVATEIGRRWGVGSVGAVGSEKRNAGLVLLIVPRQGEVRGKCFLAVGQGMEGRITDLTATSICTETIVPVIKANNLNYGAGIIAGVQRIQQLASATKTTTTTTVPNSTISSHPATWILLGLGGFVLVIVIILALNSDTEDTEDTTPTPEREPESGAGLATAAVVAAAAVAATSHKHHVEEDEDSGSSSSYSPSSYSSDDSSSSSSSGGSDFGGFGGGGGFSGGGGGGDI